MTSSGAVPRGKQVKCKVLLLDDTMPTFQVSYKAHGCDLFDAVVKHLRLLESDYFGLEYKDATGVLRWLDNEKYIVKQTGSQHDMSFRFSVKFYTPDPGLLEEEFTRYLFALQVKRDLASGSMPCNMNTAALLSAYIAQAEIGDYNYEEFTDYTYLSSIRFVPNQSNEMEEKIAEHHKNLIGHTPADADYLLLDTARKVETYGVVLHPARDHEGVPLYLSVAHMGVLVFQNNTKINTFSWAKIRKLSFKRKRFLIKLHPEGYDYYKDTVDFFFDTRDDCKAFWKKCIEHHAFFRCASIKRAPRNKTRVISRGSSFRYSGRTQKQLTDHVRENFVRRPGFERTTSVRVSSRSIGAKSNRSATLNSANASQRSLSSGSHILDDRPHDDGAAQQPSSRIETVEVHSDSSHSGALAEPGYASINYDRAAEGTPPPLYEEARPLEMNGHDLHLYETEPEPQPRVVDHEDAEDVKQNIEDLYSQVMKPHSRKLSAPDMSHLDHKEEERVVEEEHRLSRSYEVENIPVRVEEPEDHLRRTEELENIPDELGPQHGNETREEVENNKNLPRCKSESAAESMQVRMYSRPTSLSPHKEAKEESVFETQHHFNNTYGEVDYTLQTTAVTMTTSRSSEADDDRPPTPPPPLLDYQYENHVRERSEENNRVIVTSTSSSEQMMTSLTDQLQMTSMTTSPTEETPSKIQFSLGSAGSLPSREGDSTEEESRRKRYPADKAYYVAKELLMTERTYKKDLEVVTVWFQNAMSKDNVMPQYLSSMLFTQLQPIYEFHCSFLREIEQRLAMWEGKSNAHLNGNHQKIGDVVLSNLRGVLHLYQAYISQHGEILTELEQAVKEDRLFEQTYKDFESQKVCYLPLVTFLLKPAQRLLHYEIILQRLVNHYTTEHQDYHDCKASLQKIQELTNTFQDKMDELENLHKLIELERDLIGVDGLVQPSRKFLREGCLQKLSRKGYQQRMFFLFSDTLIYTSRTSTPALQFKVHGQLPLRGMIVEETDPKMAVANSFTIYGGNRCLLVAASSQEEKDKWMEDLNDASRAARTQRIEAGIKFQSLRGSTSSTENIDGEEMAPPVEKQIQHRANTTMHVCWHRNTSVSYRDHRKAIKNQLSGYLLRKFKNSSGWQKLWVVFTNFCLFFYKTFQDDFPLASLPLLGYAVSTPGDEDGIHKDYVFKLQFKNHVYFFRAESQYTFERWMEVINSATHNARRMRVFSRMESDTPDRA